MLSRSHTRGIGNIFGTVVGLTRAFLRRQCVRLPEALKPLLEETKGTWWDIGRRSPMNLQSLGVRLSYYFTWCCEAVRVRVATLYLPLS